MASLPAPPPPPTPGQHHTHTAPPPIFSLALPCSLPPSPSTTACPLHASLPPPPPRPAFRDDVNIFIVLKAMGCESDQEAVQVRYSTAEPYCTAAGWRWCCLSLGPSCLAARYRGCPGVVALNVPACPCQPRCRWLHAQAITRLAPSHTYVTGRQRLAPRLLPAPPPPPLSPPSPF